MPLVGPNSEFTNCLSFLAHLALIYRDNYYLTALKEILFSAVSRKCVWTHLELSVFSWNQMSYYYRKLIHTVNYIFLTTCTPFQGIKKGFHWFQSQDFKSVGWPLYWDLALQWQLSRNKHICVVWMGSRI